MKEQTKKFYLSIILSLIALFLISCDNKDKTGAEEGKTGAEKVKKEERTLSYYAGNWWGKAPMETAETNIFTINTDGSITVKPEGGSEVIIPSSSVTRVSDTDYTAIDPNDDSAKYIFIFSSDTQGKLTVGDTAQSVTVDITKK